ncbi:hypothetical protein BUALT_Bualt06G0098100 [Buddleja alternifolia]|uniref:Treslin n=1 Tax=Buddleja alternifolia TaxID=168488 RepID=A0AAV6XDN3_9LAMI|nr:hypothetical protein BUALT_Bualt06G0098100 [Buddleja alternifolia]
MAPENPQPRSFSRTRRLVLLIDLHPLLTLQNPTPYISAVTSAAARLLHFPPIAASLSAYKFFFSSLSPLRSAAILPRHLSTPSLSFNRPTETLASLSSTLNSISVLTDLPNSQCRSRASYTASSLLQLIHDYAWETETEKENLFCKNDFIDAGFLKIRSNLVILFSPISHLVNCLADCLDFREFDEVFCAVREAFVVRDIHLCWVDVRSRELKIEGLNDNEIECRDKIVHLKDWIKKRGWGFCSSDLIVLGSALLPLGLIYPKIGVSFDFVNYGGFDKRKSSGELSLEILDVNGMPLECKFCDLEFVNLNSLPCSTTFNDFSNALECRDSQSLNSTDAFRTGLGKGSIKLHVKAVYRYNEHQKSGGSSECVLVRECFQESEKNRKKSGDDFFADSVLEMLHKEMGGITYRSQLPTWQILLSFLHNKGYCALVSLSTSNGDTFMASLKPFTAHLAILSILDGGDVSVKDNCGYKLPKIDYQTCDEDLNGSNKCFGSQTETSTSGNYKPYGDANRKKSRRNLYKEMTWSSFYKAAFEGSNFDLFDVYNASKHFVKSKKLKFLKCWMKQINKVDPYCLTTFPGSKSVEELSACNALSSEPSPTKDGDIPVVSNLETSENFFNNLSRRIQHGLESGMDLQSLAERVVKSSIHWLRLKCETENCSEDQQPIKNLDDLYSEDVGGKLMKLLLRAPKEMKKIHQDSDPYSSSENIVREYEMQIFLRIEILRSDVSAMMGGSRKQKLLKQICSLLEIIQYLVGGGIHGHVNLYDYVERTIRARYSDELEYLMKSIYSKMDLLPFGDEGETPSLLFNSEDSNQSWRDKNDRNEKAEANSINSTEGESSQPLTYANESLNDTVKDEHARILNEARERRERARRFAPFTNRARDLQRVWAPKQPKTTKDKFDHLPKKSKRKDRQGPSYSVVCETPMTGNRRASCVENSKGDKATVSKALFQE